MVTGVTEELGETHTPAWGCQTIPERNNTKKKKKKSSPFHHVLTHLHLPWSWEKRSPGFCLTLLPLGLVAGGTKQIFGKAEAAPFPLFLLRKV